MDENGAVFNVGSFVVRSGTGDLNLVDRWQGSAGFLDDYTDDNVLTLFEKRMLKIKWTDIKRRYDSNLLRIQHHYPDNGAGLSFVSAYKNAYTNLYEYLFVDLVGVHPLLAEQNMGNNSAINSVTFNGMFGAYESALVELDRQFDLNLQEKITSVEFVITDEEIISAVTRTETWIIRMNEIDNAIEQVGQQAEDAYDAINGMMSDLSVTPIEKQSRSLIWSDIKQQYTQL